MKLIRNIERSERGDETDILTSLICSAGLLLCMVFAIFGIKFRWFKHRLSFQQLPDTSDRGGGTSTHSQTGVVVPLQGVFRRREDADSFVEIERQKTLPPIRIRSTDVQIPVPNRLSQITPTHTSSGGAVNISLPPNPPPMPSAPSSASLHQQRSEPSNRSQASSRSKSSERSKKSDEQTTASAKSGSSSSSPRKKKGQDEGKSKSSPSTNPQNSEPNKKPRDKDKNKEKGRKAPLGVTFEPRKPKKHSDQTRHFEKLKDDRPNVKAVGERRPTGFNRPNVEEMEALEKLSSLDDANRVQVDGLSDNDDENQMIFEKVKTKPVPEPRKRISSENASAPIPTPPVASVASKPTDSWSAVARHRILTEELTKQHSALKPVDARSNGTGEYRNPLSSSSESKPRTMRDMKKSKDIMSHNERVVLGQEQQREDTDA